MKIVTWSSTEALVLTVIRGFFNLVSRSKRRFSLLSCVGRNIDKSTIPFSATPADSLLKYGRGSSPTPGGYCGCCEYSACDYKIPRVDHRVKIMGMHTIKYFGRCLVKLALKKLKFVYQNFLDNKDQMPICYALSHNLSVTECASKLTIKTTLSLGEIDSCAPLF